MRHRVLNSAGDHVLLTDSDLSCPIEEYHKLAAPVSFVDNVTIVRRMEAHYEDC